MRATAAESNFTNLSFPHILPPPPTQKRYSIPYLFSPPLIENEKGPGSTETSNKPPINGPARMPSPNSPQPLHLANHIKGIPGNIATHQAIQRVGMNGSVGGEAGVTGRITVKKEQRVLGGSASRNIGASEGEYAMVVGILCHGTRYQCGRNS